MKRFFIVTLFVIFIHAVQAQSDKKMVIVVNKADWCHVCQANGEKVMKEGIPVFENTNISFVMNDLTDKTSKKNSRASLKEMKVYQAVKMEEQTGLLLLVDPASGKTVEKISVSEPADKLIMKIRKMAEG